MLKLKPELAPIPWKSISQLQLEFLTKRWDMSNRASICPLCRLVKPDSGTIEHLLLSGGCPWLKQGCQWCPLLQQTWSPFNYYWRTMNPTTMQFLPDCSVLEPALKISKESESDQIKVFVTQRWLLFLADMEKVVILPRTRYVKNWNFRKEISQNFHKYLDLLIHRLQICQIFNI